MAATEALRPIPWTSGGSMDEHVSVVICCHTLDRWSLVCDAVESVRTQSLHPRKTIIVVDHNVALFDRAVAEFTDCTVLQSEGLKGLSGARNTGVAAAQGDIVAFLDDDAVADSMWLRHLVNTFEEQVVGVGGAIDPAWPGAAPSFFPPEFNWVIGCTYPGMANGREEIRNMFGANMAFKADILRSVGGFRSSVGRTDTELLGGEETELCIRTAEMYPGVRIMFEPEAKISHRVSDERTTWKYFLRRCYSEGISTARVVGMTSIETGLESERHYVWSILPRGFARAIAEAVRSRQIAPLAKSVAIVTGLTVTTVGFVAERARDWRRRGVATPARLEEAV